MTKPPLEDNTAAFAEALFIANLLFVGVFYLALWLLNLLRYKQTSVLGRQHLRQTLLASSLSTLIFIAINSYVVLTSNYASLTALFLLEIYFMLIVPIFLIAGIIGFTKAIKGVDFSYPIIGQLSK